MSKNKLVDDRAHWHSSLTDDVIAEAVERRMRSLDNPGFCVVCGLENGGCEPDARGYPCEGCGEKAVYGADELLLRI